MEDIMDFVMGQDINNGMCFICSIMQEGPTFLSSSLEQDHFVIIGRDSSETMSPTFK